MKKLPIGIYSFEKIRSDDFYYVDKTPYIVQLAEQAGYYFLSRPRRFGKSLFLDTLKCAFECRQDLFNGLYLEKNWDFEKPYPVLKFSLGRGRVASLEELNYRLLSILDEQAQRHELDCRYKLVADRFFDLIKNLYDKT
ncbi:MAG TPA: AAA family ATPase, partial [Desulfohalobiaceae bacterium]|nr:AAA family ATPase [Desulfohalobiaceae bacterium]